ncbi:Syntaxin [Parasponia andersonii]|uniref:Syntaxin n=1 Tax=Parasponia andersonii TaxID=3476 RepID=A0A2P5CDA9_PARAD|nr:Syntaxin [Parasponia andersonii]
MNDLMTKSFLSFVELKKQARKDLEADVDIRRRTCLSFTKKLVKLSLNEEAKSTHSAKILLGLSDRMDSNIVALLRKVRRVKTRLENLDQYNVNNRGRKDKIVEHHNEDLRRKHFCATVNLPREESIEKMAYGAVKVEMFEGKTEVDMENNKVRHETVIDIERSLNKLSAI